MGTSNQEAVRHETRSPGNTLSYVALVLTLVVAVLQLVAALRGRPMAWPSTALLIALCAVSVTGFMQSPAVKRALTVIGLVFALAAIYGMLTR